MMNETSNGQTHYEGCWRSGEYKHMLCALQCLKDILNIFPANFHHYFDAVKKQSPLDFKTSDGKRIVEINYETKEVVLE